MAVKLRHNGQWVGGVAAEQPTVYPVSGGKLTDTSHFDSFPFAINIPQGTTNYSQMFVNMTGYRALPTVDVTGVTNLMSMYNGCSQLVTVQDFSAAAPTNTKFMFSVCSSLLTLPAINTSQVTDATSMFSGCSKITEIPAYDFSGLISVNSANPNLNIFASCTALTRIRATGLRYAFSISGAKLQATELNELFTNLGTAAGAQTVTITNNPGAGTCNRTLATSKGWTVSG